MKKILSVIYIIIITIFLINIVKCKVFNENGDARIKTCSVYKEDGKKNLKVIPTKLLINDNIFFRLTPGDDDFQYSVITCKCYAANGSCRLRLEAIDNNKLSALIVYITPKKFSSISNLTSEKVFKAMTNVKKYNGYEFCNIKKNFYLSNQPFIEKNKKLKKIGKVYGYDTYKDLVKQNVYFVFGTTMCGNYRKDIDKNGKAGKFGHDCIVGVIHHYEISSVAVCTDGMKYKHYKRSGFDIGDPSCKWGM